MKNLPAHHRSLVRSEDKRGFTLLEITVVLGIVSIIIGGVWVAYGSVNARNNVNQAAQELQTVSQNMLSIYQGRPLPAAALAGCPALPEITANAISSGALPSWAVVTGACASAVHPWPAGGGNFKIFEYSFSANSFRVSFYNIPLDGCIGLLLQGTNCDPSQPGCPINVVTAGGADSLLPNAGPPQNWQNITPALAAGATLCGANAPPDSGGANSVEFDFQL